VNLQKNHPSIDQFIQNQQNNEDEINEMEDEIINEIVLIKYSSPAKVRNDLICLTSSHFSF